MRRAMTAASVALVMIAASTAQALPLPARDSAAVQPKGAWSVGVFNPFELSLSDTVAIRTSPLPVARPPVIDVRVAHLVGDWRLTGEYGLGLPGLAMFMAIPLGVKGDLVPSCKVAAHDGAQDKWCLAPGFTVVPRVALVASTGKRHVTTARLDFAYGLALSGDLGQPLDAMPPLDLAWAAAINGWHGRAGLRYDRSFTDCIRLSAEANLHLVAATPAPVRSPWTVSAHAGADFAVGARSRVTIGVFWYNSDQRATELQPKDGFVERVGVRSNDFYPTIDFIWAG